MLLEQSEPKKGDHRKTNVPIFDSAVPLMRKNKATARDDGAGPGGSSMGEVPTEANGLMKFMLLTKKGNKPQVSPSASLSCPAHPMPWP